MELANIIVIKRSTSYLHSELFQWTAPLAFSLTAMFTRLAAEWTVVPLLEASKMSTVSLGLGVLFTRLAQSAVIDDVRLVLVLEVFYAFLNNFLKVSLYSRHAILSSCSQSGTFKVRGVPRNARAQGITTVSNVTELIFDTVSFIIVFLARFLLLPSSITTTDLTLVFCVCIAIQIFSTTATVGLVSYFEGIPIEDFFVSWTVFGDFWPSWIYLWVSTMMGLVYISILIVNVWDPSLRTHVPWY